MPVKFGMKQLTCICCLVVVSSSSHSLIDHNYCGKTEYTKTCNFQINSLIYSQMVLFSNRSNTKQFSISTTSKNGRPNTKNFPISNSLLL